MSTAEAITTAEQLLQASDLGPCELLRGELIRMNAAGFEHGRIVSRINARLQLFAETHKLGDPSAISGPVKQIVVRATGAEFR